MDLLKIARGAKVVALVGFLLPWIVVSCQGQTVAKASGVSLALGRMTVVGGGTQSGTPVIWVLLAIVATIAGLVMSFQAAEKLRPRWIAGTAAAAALLCMITPGTVAAGAHKRGASQGLDAVAAAAIKVEPQIGYWITLLALLTAAGLGGLMATGREDLLNQVLAGRLPGGLAGGGSGGQPDPELAFWDGMADKNDPDLLEEYLARFPSGRFAELARARLSKVRGPGGEPPPETPPAETPSAEPPPEATVDEAPAAAEVAMPQGAADRFCSACGAKATSGGRFCVQCGQAL